MCHEATEGDRDCSIERLCQGSGDIRMVLAGHWEESEMTEDRKMTTTALIHLGCLDKGSDLWGRGLT